MESNRKKLIEQTNQANTEILQVLLIGKALQLKLKEQILKLKNLEMALDGKMDSGLMVLGMVVFGKMAYGIMAHGNRGLGKMAHGDMVYGKGEDGLMEDGKKELG
jgi:hypothetical protein